MATVVVINHGTEVTIGGVTFAHGNNNIDSDILELLAELHLLGAEHAHLNLEFDLSAMEP